MNLSNTNQKKSLLYLTASLLIACLLLVGTPYLANAAPGIPAGYGGTVTIGGATASSGYTVTAKIDGVEVGTATTDSSGQYAMTVAGTDGTTVNFYVGGTLSSQTVTFTSGDIKTVNLSVTSASKSTALSISTSSVSSGVVGTSYSKTLSATGGSGSYAWTVSSGSLPDGLSLSTAGIISGTPTTANTYSFTVQVTDSASTTATKTYSVTVSSSSSTPSISTSSLPGGTVGTSYAANLAATGGSGSYIWTLSDGSLPNGLSLSSAGVISGMPASATTLSFTVMATDADSHSASKTLSLYIAAAATTTPSTTPSTTSPSSSSTSPSSSTGSSPSQPSSTPASAITAFAISDMTATPIATKTGTRVDISIRVANTGKAQSVKSLLLKINDNVEAQQDIVLDPGESQVVTFTVNKNTPGTYKASIDPLSTDFVITSAPSTPQSNDSGIPVMGILIGGGLLVVLVILLLIRQRRQS